MAILLRFCSPTTKLPFWWSKITRILVALGLLSHLIYSPYRTCPLQPREEGVRSGCMLPSAASTFLKRSHGVSPLPEPDVLGPAFLCWCSECFQKWPEELICFCFSEHFHDFFLEITNWSSGWDWLSSPSWPLLNFSYCWRKEQPVLLRHLAGCGSSINSFLLFYIF